MTQQEWMTLFCEIHFSRQWGEWQRSMHHAVMEATHFLGPGEPMTDDELAAHLWAVDWRATPLEVARQIWQGWQQEGGECSHPFLLRLVK